MTARSRLAFSAVLIFVSVAVSPLSPVRPAGHGARASVPPASDVLLLNARGTSQRVSGSAADHFVYEVDLFNAGDDKVGTVTYDMAMTSITQACFGLTPDTAAAGPLGQGDGGTFDLVTTFHFADGDLVNHGVMGFGTDGSRPGVPGVRLVGVHPEKDTIVSDKNTGAYAGLTGRLCMAGWHDVNKFPGEDTFDDLLSHRTEAAFVEASSMDADYFSGGSWAGRWRATV